MAKNQIYPIENNFSTEMLDEDVIRHFCHNMVTYDGIDALYQDRLADSLIQLCAKSPTARMSLRATIHNVNEQRRMNPDYKLEVNFSGKTPPLSGMVHSKRPNVIYIFHNTIEDRLDLVNKFLESHDLSVPDEKYDEAYTYDTGIVFLHEAQHIRQLQNKDILNDALNNQVNFQHLDAAPQALSRQIAIELNNPYLNIIYTISNKERHQNLTRTRFGTKNVQKNSKKNQQAYGIDFASVLSAKPSTNHGLILWKWEYIKKDIFLCLDPTVKNSEPKFSTALQNYLSHVNNIHVQNGASSNAQIEKYFKPLLSQVQKTFSKEEKEKLFKAIFLNKPFKKSHFSSPEKYTLAKQILDDVKDIEKNLMQLSYISASIYDGNNTGLNKAKEIREHLKKKYGIHIPSHNKSGERIARNSTLNQTLAHAGNNISRQETHLNPTTPHNTNNDGNGNIA